MRIVILGVLFSCGCGSAPLPQTTALRFEPCGVVGDAGDVDDGDEVECARARVPYDWACAAGACDTPPMNLLVRRVRAPAPSRGQLWALDGGPGFAGGAFFDPGFVEIVHAAGYDLYVPTHRGTPGSEGLSCPSAEAPDSEGGGFVTNDELPACRDALEAQWGTLEHFSSVAAGRDVAHLLSLAPERERTALFGGSYGTLWAQRVLQAAAPDAFDLVWLDSVVEFGGTLENADQHADRAARALFTQCEASGACPIDIDIDIDGALAVIAAHDAGEGCTDASGAELRLMGYRFVSANIQDRLVFVEFLARAERCDADDQAALAHALARFRETPATPVGAGFPYAPLLNNHIIAAELDGGEAPTPQAGLLASRAGDTAVRARIDAWGAVPLATAPIDSDTHTDARVILWSGALDPLDPPEWAERTAARWGAEWILVESAGHSVLRYARTASGNCAQEIWHALLADPSAALDRGCVSQIETIDWQHARPQTRALLGEWFGE